jgi:hypothetical protein
MLNIISRSIVSKHTRGPRKVVVNLLKGLDALGVPYMVNAALDATSELWIHDDPVALKAAAKLPPSTSIIAGPNVYTLPTELPSEVDVNRMLWLHPAAWVQEFWHAFGGSHIPSAVWPVGIDTAEFAPTPDQKNLVLVYNKDRAEEEVTMVTSLLRELGEQYQVITYGSYSETEYQGLLAQAKAIIWVGRSESQGIGLLEALAMNVPMLVWGVTRFGYWVGPGRERFSLEQLAFTPVSTAPYFDDRCGVIVTEFDDLSDTLPIFLEGLAHYTPRAYIESELSLTHAAEAFLRFYTEHFGVSREILMTHKLLNTKQWQNATLSFRLKSQLKDAVRQIIR